MAFVLLIIGAILVVSAIGNTQASLATALTTDVPGYVHWAAAIAAIGAIGMIPGMRTVSRWMLALILVVLVLRNYTQILGGFTGASQSATPAPQAAATPVQQFASGGNALASAGGVGRILADVPMLAEFGGLFG